mgnify:CR=1 FL=1|jgi:hypothetical protein|tara:strand:- start:414 stop:629 length:216 start_codon:yes stop_codon:yes gene_type:complete
MNIIKTSQISGKKSNMDIDITKEQLFRVENRLNKNELIQNIVPNLSMDEREFLMTGITSEEWTNVFGKIEE